MTLTPSAVRNDLKCGKGAISKGEKCTKGPATAVEGDKPQSQASLRDRAVVTGGVVGGAALVGTAILTRKRWTPAVERAFKEAVAVAGSAPIPPKGSKFLAKGYAGAIYRAKDKKSVFKINFKRNIAGRKQFEQELATQATLHKKGINTPDVLAVDRRRSIAQIEYLDGYKNLTDIAKNGTSAQKSQHAKQFLVEMSKLHKAGYSHSDMHLGNTMAKDGDVKLIDWGYARPIEKAPKTGMRNDMTHIKHMLEQLDKKQHSRFKDMLEKTGLQTRPPTKQAYSDFWDRFFADDRTDSFRLDLKCGKGAISKGEKCTKGSATATKPNNTIRNIALGVGGAAVLGGAAFGFAKHRSAKPILSRPQGKNLTPDDQIARGNKAFNDMRGVARGAEIASAGLGIAGAGVVANEYAKDPKKRQAGAIMAGGALTYLSVATALGAVSVRNKLGPLQAQFNMGAEDYKREWNAAREQAQQRARQNTASGNQGSRNVGSNKAVQNPFKDLNIPESASDADIKKQWLKLMRENHPDVGGDPRKAQQINAAYQEIMRRRGKLDSMYADGFDFDLEALGL